MTTGQTPLWSTSWSGHLKCAELLLKRGADVNKARDEDSTPLLLASKNGHCDIVDALLREGADVNKARNDGCTPLHLSRFHGHKTCFEALARAGADFSLAFRGQTSLDLSPKKGHVESIGISTSGGGQFAVGRS